QDALVVTLAADTLPVLIVLEPTAKEALEDQARVDLLGYRRRLAAPRQVGLVSTAVTVVTGAGVLAALAAYLQRGEAGDPAHALGGHLIDGDAGAEVGSIGLARVAAGQECGHGASVVAAAVAVRPGLVEGQPAEDEHILFDCLQRLENGRQLEIRSDRWGR